MSFPSFVSQKLGEKMQLISVCKILILAQVLLYIGFMLRSATFKAYYACNLRGFWYVWNKNTHVGKM